MTAKRPHPTPPLVALLAGAHIVTALGCTGSIGGTTGDGAPGGANGDGPGANAIVPGPDGEPLRLACDGTAPSVGETRIHRLTERQYENTVRELIGESTLDVSLAEDESENPSALAVTRWNAAAMEIGNGIKPWMNSYVDGCSLNTGGEACAKEFAANFAERAFRRPLTGAEKTWVTGIWAALPAADNQSQKLGGIVELVLQAPQFLYLAPEGTGVDGLDRIRELAPYEMAERLSYFFWDSLPDAELLDAAAKGSLATEEGILEQANRMLEDDRARPVLRGYLTRWMDLEGEGTNGVIDGMAKDADMFPEFTPSLPAALRRETEAFMDYVMTEKDGSLEALLTDTRAYVNGPLAKLYGVEGGPTGEDEWAWVDLDPSQRAGVLTRAGFLAVHATREYSSPIRRGAAVLRKMLCQPPPPPPSNVDNTPVTTTGSSDSGEVPSIREQTILRTSQGTCAGCHTAINGIGFAFEHYDGLGMWQDPERGTGATIDSTGTLLNAGVANGDVADAVELSERLLETDWVRECAVEHWFEQAVRRSPSAADACTQQRTRDAMGRPGNLKDLLRAFVTSDVFRYIDRGE
ncbi:MAG: DUF1592 domain-containing protein [Myxococcales bacterium]|nr:DUF1592 domain-containing protein [Myxococcales bacterium]